MRRAINEIIRGIRRGYFFDSHFMISQIIRRYSDLYIHFAGPRESTAHMHGRIAQLIQQSPSVRLVSRNFWSNNIHGKQSPCALWERIR